MSEPKPERPKDKALDDDLVMTLVELALSRPRPFHRSRWSIPSNRAICSMGDSAASKQGEIDFLTMEFLERETLTERLRHGPIAEAEAQAIAAQLCAGVAEAHRNTSFTTI